MPYLNQWTNIYQRKGKVDVPWITNKVKQLIKKKDDYTGKPENQKTVKVKVPKHFMILGKKSVMCCTQNSIDILTIY